ncbi:MAG TPA: hypothetical protein VLJ42_01140 [Solirubrobacteraceae bacterium]|nr:hypothetical protein [Solirubrobacteraceae bacterium]
MAGVRAPKRSCAAVIAAGLVFATAAAAAAAVASVVNVRIEGATHTLFEGPILTTGHALRAGSDTGWHTCDGTNANAHATPGPTPTAAAADGLALLNLGFDGQWYPGYDDYFVKQLGPDREGAGAYWGVLVNAALTPVGGCQFELAPGDDVLWAYDAFRARAFLQLTRAAACPLPGAPATVAPATLPGTSVSLRVCASSGGSDAAPGSAMSAPQAGIAVAEVDPANGAVRGQSAPSAADGAVSIPDLAPGWHRFKSFGDPASFVRSNRVDVCVDSGTAGDCAAVLTDAVVRQPPSTPDDPGAGHGTPAAPAPSAPSIATGLSAPASTLEPIIRGATAVGSVRLSAPHIDASGRDGRLIVSWSVLDGGPGIRGWALAARVRGARGAAWSTLARGRTATTARVRAPAGLLAQLRLTVTDELGRSSSGIAGQALVPIDDRARSLQLRGGWQHERDARAWERTLTQGRRGCQLRVRLAAGRPTLLLRAARESAWIEVRAGGHAETFGIAAGDARALRRVVAARRSSAGDVTVKVLSGAVRLDGVAAQP